MIISWCQVHTFLTLNLMILANAVLASLFYTFTVKKGNRTRIGTLIFIVIYCSGHF